LNGKRLKTAWNLRLQLTIIRFGSKLSEPIIFTNMRMRINRGVCSILLQNRLLVFAPLVLLAHLLLLAGSEVVLDVECLANLLGGLALDHVGNSLAGHVQKALNVQVVSSLKCKCKTQ